MDVSFEKTKGEEQWLTPPEIIKALGEFTIDPCSPIERPWDTAKVHFNKNDDGLSVPWYGRVWLNPPYGDQTWKWLDKLSKHGNGIALVFARTDTKGFHEQVFGKADALLFLKGRLKFYRVDGTQGDSAGAPSVLIAYGEENVYSLKTCGLNGKFIKL